MGAEQGAATYPTPAPDPAEADRAAAASCPRTARRPASRSAHMITSIQEFGYDVALPFPRARPPHSLTRD
jgi:hypothetical protein